MGVYVYGVIRLLGLCGFNELARHFIAVWTAGILGADGYLTFSTGKAVANASHVHAYSLRNARRQRGGTAVSHFLIYRDMGVHRALGLSAAFPDVFANAQQYAYGQLVIQESALYVPALCYPRPGLKANYVPNLYAKTAGILFGFYVLVQHYLLCVEAALRIAVFAVHVYRCVAELAGSLDSPAASGIHPHVFRLGVIGLHSAYVGYAQPAV